MLYECIVQKEVNDVDVKDTIVIIPTLADVVAHNDFWKGITGLSKRLVLADCSARINTAASSAK